MSVGLYVNEYFFFVDKHLLRHRAQSYLIFLPIDLCEVTKPFNKPAIFSQRLSYCSLQVCAELEEERRKHERDAAQGDDVLVMLEKERERLKSEVITIKS